MENKSLKDQKRYSDQSGDIVEQYDKPNELESEKIIPRNKGCGVDEMISESYRMDDNAHLSPTAETGLSNCIDDTMVPGVGVEENIS